MALADGEVYYGSVDATPLFVMLVHEMAVGHAARRPPALLPAVDAALTAAGPGDPDADGYVEYERRSPEGLANQGWKDSWDGVSFADGRIADPPIALAEVQGYAYAPAGGPARRWPGRPATRPRPRPVTGGPTCCAGGSRATSGCPTGRASPWRSTATSGFVDAGLEHGPLPVDRDRHRPGPGRGRRPPPGVAGHEHRLGDLHAGRGDGPVQPTHRPQRLGGPTTPPSASPLRCAGFADEAVGWLQAAAAADACDGRPPELFAGLTRDELPVPVPTPPRARPRRGRPPPRCCWSGRCSASSPTPGRPHRAEPGAAGGHPLPAGGRTPLAGGCVTIESDDGAVALRGLRPACRGAPGRTGVVAVCAAPAPEPARIVTVGEGTHG